MDDVGPFAAAAWRADPHHRRPADPFEPRQALREAGRGPARGAAGVASILDPFGDAAGSAASVSPRPVPP